MEWQHESVLLLSTWKKSQTWMKVAGSEEILRELTMDSTTWEERQQRYKLQFMRTARTSNQDVIWPLNVKFWVEERKSRENPGFVEDAIRIIGHKPTKSPTRNNPSLWYRSKCYNRSNRPKCSHWHIRVAPKSKVGIHFIRNHKNPKHSCSFSNLKNPTNKSLLGSDIKT